MPAVNAAVEPAAPANKKGSNPFYTIGHSTRPIEEFVHLLQDATVTLVVDVRTIPRSRTNPQYNRDVLPSSLAAQGIGYEHLAELGGRRSRQRDVAESLNAYWQHASFHNYADYALSAAFQSGLLRLRTLNQEHRCAIMCSEAVWWRCHRRIITDYLLAGGASVLHILGPKHIEPATMTPAARGGPDALTYPASTERP